MSSSITDIPLSLQNQVSRIDRAHQQQIQKVLQQISPGSAAAVSVRPPALEELLKPVQRVNAMLRAYGVQFELSEEHGRVITRLVDQDSGDVIRQIPSEAVLRVLERLHEQPGLFVNEKV